MQFLSCEGRLTLDMVCLFGFLSNITVLLLPLASQYYFFFYLSEDIKKFDFRRIKKTFIPGSSRTLKALEYLLYCHDENVIIVSSGTFHIQSIMHF